MTISLYNIGTRVATIKSIDKRGNSIYTYGNGTIVAKEIPDSEAITYASERAREQGLETFKIELDENDAGNEYVYGTECVIFEEETFNEVYANMYKRLLSIKADRYRYWKDKQKEEERKLP